MNEAALGLAEDPQPVSSKNRLSRPTHHSQSNSTGLRSSSAVQNGDFFSCLASCSAQLPTLLFRYFFFVTVQVAIGGVRSALFYVAA